MISNEQPGLVESIRSAVLPLTETREFVFESISIDEYESTISTNLSSSLFTISFYTGAIHSGVGCVMRIPVARKKFLTEYLFPALYLENLEIKGEYLSEYPYPDPSTNEVLIKYQAKWDAIIKATGFIKKMNELCFGIRDNLPVIQEAFLPENIDTTIKAYLVELRKTSPYATESACEIKEWNI